MITSALKKYQPALIIAIAVQFILLNLVWLKQADGFLSGDSAEHLYYTHLAGLFLEDPGWSHFEILLDQTGYYSPLPYLLNGLAAKLLPSFPLQNLFPCLSFLYGIGALFVFYQISRKYLPFPWRIWSIIVLSASPIFLALLKLAMLDMFLFFTVSTAFLCLVNGWLFQKPVTSFATGCIFAIGFLAKFTFIVFLAGPLLIYCLYYLKENKQLPLLSLLLFAGGFAMISGPWILYKFDFLLTSPTIHEAGAIPFEASSWSRLSYYFKEFVRTYFSPLLGYGVAAAGIILLGKKNEKLFKNLRDPKWASLLLFIGVPLLFFSILPNKDHRHLVPILIPFILLTARLFASLPGRAIQVFIFCLFTAVALVNQYRMAQPLLPHGLLLSVPGKNLTLLPPPLAIISGGCYGGIFHQQHNQHELEQMIVSINHQKNKAKKVLICQLMGKNTVRFDTLYYPFFYAFKYQNYQNEILAINGAENLTEHQSFINGKLLILSDAPKLRLLEILNKQGEMQIERRHVKLIGEYDVLGPVDSGKLFVYYKLK